jgi:hypothetical protein
MAYTTIAPATPQLRRVPASTFISRDSGHARWDIPERQQPRGFRQKSIEHKFLTPVFGTAQPLRGLSGAIRRYAYTFSEGRVAHWILLMVGDRVDLLESRLEAIRSGRPDNPITETGVLREFKDRAYRDQRKSLIAAQLGSSTASSAERGLHPDGTASASLRCCSVTRHSRTSNDLNSGIVCLTAADARGHCGYSLLQPGAVSAIGDPERVQPEPGHRGMHRH